MSEAEILSLVDVGLYKDAAAAIDSLSNPNKSLRVLRAHLEEHVGSVTHARATAESLLREGLPASEKARCYDVIGRAAMSLGQVEPGLKAMRAALALAAEAQSPRLEARLLFSNAEAHLHWMNIERAAQQIPKLRRACLASGDPYSLIGLHTLLAEIQAKKGIAAAARLSIKTARSLLQSWPNVYQQGRLAVIGCGLESFQSNYEAALEFTMEALACSERSGSREIGVPALANLAHIKLALGELGEARSAITEVLTVIRRGGDAEIGALDTEMDIALAGGELELAQTFAARIAALSAQFDNGNSYHRLWNLFTQIRLLYRTGNEATGLRMALDAIPRAERFSDQILVARLQLMAAEGFGRRGEHAKGATLIAQAMNANFDPPLEVIAEAARITGRITTTDDPIASQEHFDRAARMFKTIGNMTSVAAVESDAKELLQNGHHPDRRRPQPESTQSLSAQIATLLELGGHPLLLAAEVLSLIRATGAASVATLTETQEGTQNIQNGAHEIRIPLGDYGNRKYAIVVTPNPSAIARTTILSVERLVHAALVIAEARRNKKERAELWPAATPERELGMICASERTADLIKTIRRVADPNLTVLFTGESGVGKELFARALHMASPRKDRTFLPFNCATVPKDMLDSQLFGHRRGAFTGAHEAGSGVIRAAAGGTLFLDEISELSVEAQPKLLRFLESGEIHPLGEPKPLLVDVRIVAATNKDLEQLVSDGKFREDLYYRLNVLPIHIPPLRERREEIPALVEHFLERYCREMQKPMLPVADETLEYLLLYRWPGNVRQLGNELRRIVALAEPGDTLTPSHLSQDIIASRRTIPVQQSEVVIDLAQPLQQATSALERAAIERALKAADGNNDEAAKALGLSRKGLYLKRQRLGLK